MKKYNLYLGVLIIGLFLILPFNTYALKNLGRDVKPFTQINNKMYSAFSAEDHFDQSKGTTYVKWLQKDSEDPIIAYCMDHGTPFDTVDDYKNAGAVDIGIQYIIKNGFTGRETSGQSYHYSTNSNCSATDCSALVNLKTNAPMENKPWYVNYWLTQIAIWAYQGVSIPGISGSNLTDYQKAVKTLVSGAKSVSKSTVNFVNVSPKMTISDANLTLDGDYYYSKKISSSDTGETFSVSVNNANYEVVDANKKAKTTFNSGDKFYIRVLKSKVTKTESVTVTLATMGATYANAYTSSDGAQKLVRYVVTKQDEKKTTLKVKVTYDPNCDLTVKVVDSVTKEQICGGKLTVYDEQGNVAKNSEGVEVGKIELTNTQCEVKLSLPKGKYRVVQDSTIEPYIKDSKSYDVDTSTTCPVTIELKNTKDNSCDLTVKVVDSETKEKICGGKLTVYDEQGNIAKDDKGVEVGKIELTNDKCEVKLSLPKGKYRVVQDSTIEPYIKDSKSYDVDTSTTCPAIIELQNEKLYQIRVLKVDGDNKPLAGAKLKLTDSNGNTIKEFVSNTDSIIIDKLHKGTYYLSEIKAPEGYSLNSEKITIEVNNDNNNKLFNFSNDEIVVPITGLDTKLTILSLVVGIFGIGLIYYSRKKRYA